MGAILLDLFPVLLGMAGLIVFSALCSSSETAIFSLGTSDLRRMGPVGERIGRMLSDQQRVLVTILLANLITNVLYFTFVGTVTSRFLSGGHTIAGALTPLIGLVVIIIFGEIFPKVMAVLHPRRIARFTYRFVLVLQRALAPARVVLGGIAMGLQRLIVGQHTVEGDLSREELTLLLDLAGREGSLEEDEIESLQAALLLNDMQIREIMVPRVQISAFPADGDRNDLVHLIDESRHNKIPIYEGDRDHIIGFVDAKVVLSEPEKSLRDILVPVVHVPESASVSSVMERFLQSRPRLLVVVDEHGGTEGIVTHEDLIEAVVGDLSDEDAEPEPMVIQREDGVFDVDGRLGLRRMGKILGCPVSKSKTVTIGGLVTTGLQRFPRVGDHLQVGHL
ncbi:MAG TPA: hemolysin family protein, partial [Planctomycetota bacterium]|nr:hemolysin family protein [Planctomycetota bacterium]